MNSIPRQVRSTLVNALALAGAFCLGLMSGPGRSSVELTSPSPLLPSTGSAGTTSALELPGASTAAAVAVLADRPRSVRVDGVARDELGALPGTSSRPRIQVAEVLSASEVTLTVDFLVEMGRLDEAYKLILEMPADSNETYTGLGVAMAAKGRTTEASLLYSEALRRGSWYDEMIEEFVAVDPAGCLAAIERESERWTMGLFLDEEDLASYRAQALQGMGRSGEAVALLPDPDRLLVAGTGCVPLHIDGEDWEWRAWIAAAPNRVEGLLLEVVRHPIASTGRARMLLTELYAMHGRHEDLEQALTSWQEESRSPQTAASYSRAVVALAPIRGWDKVQEVLESRPCDYDAALGLGNHFAESGNMHEAARVWGDYMEASWEADSDTDLLIETVMRAPEHLMPRLESIVDGVLAREDEPEEFPYAIGCIGDVLWGVGEHSRAIEFWRRAEALDPTGYWSWDIQQAELGVNPQ